MTSRSELLRLQAEGPVREFRAALRSMRWRRSRALWTEFGMKVGQVFSPIMLTVVYLTVFMPFGLLGRLSRKPTGWRTPQRQPNTALQSLKLQA